MATRALLAPASQDAPGVLHLEGVLAVAQQPDGHVFQTDSHLSRLVARWLGPTGSPREPRGGNRRKGTNAGTTGAASDPPLELERADQPPGRPIGSLSGAGHGIHQGGDRARRRQSDLRKVGDD
eukprot:4132656-Lingulodinium_polyedra.AAC.1